MAANDSQTAAIENEIAHLRGLDLDALRARWRSQTGRAAPSHLPKSLLLRVLAYRAQAAVFGDLDKATARLLDRIADEAGSGTRIEVPVPDRVGIRPGTLLVREWEGVSHRVMVMAEGFAWNGCTIRASPGWPARSPARAGMARASSACGTRRVWADDQARPEGAALRHLHPCLDRARPRAGLQLARCAARGGASLREEPDPRGLAPGQGELRRWRLLGWIAREARSAASPRGNRLEAHRCGGGLQGRPAHPLAR